MRFDFAAIQEQGKQAFRDGLNIDACPYPTNKEESGIFWKANILCWRDGWKLMYQLRTGEPWRDNNNE